MKSAVRLAPRSVVKTGCETAAPASTSVGRRVSSSCNRARFVGPARQYRSLPWSTRAIQLRRTNRASDQPTPSAISSTLFSELDRLRPRLAPGLTLSIWARHPTSGRSRIVQAIVRQPRPLLTAIRFPATQATRRIRRLYALALGATVEPRWPSRAGARRGAADPPPPACDVVLVPKIFYPVSRARRCCAAPGPAGSDARRGRFVLVWMPFRRRRKRSTAHH